MPPGLRYASIAYDLLTVRVIVLSCRGSGIHRVGPR